MTTPGQQLDERHDALAAKVAENAAETAINSSTVAVHAGMLSSVYERLADLEEWQRNCKCATVDLDPPAPDLDAPRIDMSGVPDVLKAGDEPLKIPIRRIVDGERIWVHWWMGGWDGQLHRRRGIVENGEVEVIIIDRPGDAILQLQYGDMAKAHREVTITADVSPPEIIIPPTVTTRAIARWSEPPMVEITGKYEIGVAAHHSYGIKYVEIEGERIDSPSVNPRTREFEYWKAINAEQYADGLHELSATAYPVKGVPRELDPLKVWMNARGRIKFPTHLIRPDDTAIPRDLKCPDDRWLTVKYADGANQRVTLGTRTSGNIRPLGLNMKGGTGNQGWGDKGRIWFDDCDYLGVESAFTPGDRLDDATTLGPVTHHWREAYYTDFEVDHVACPLVGNRGLARNVQAGTVYEDAIRLYGLVTNMTIDRIVRGVPSGDWGYVHSDVFQLSNDLHNGIYQNITCGDAKAQGLSGGGHYDCAFVNIKVNVTDGNIGLRLFGDQHNVLYQDIDIKSPVGHEITGKPLPISTKDVVLRRVKNLPSGLPRKGVEVVE